MSTTPERAALAGYLAGTYRGVLPASGGKEAALIAAQHMLDEVLSCPDIINTENLRRHPELTAKWSPPTSAATTTPWPSADSD